MPSGAAPLGAGNGHTVWPGEGSGADPARRSRGGIRRAGIAASGGILLALAFPAVDWGPLAWIAFVPVLWAGLGHGTRTALLTGWIGGLCFFLSTLYWLVLTIGTYTNLSPVAAVGPLVLLCAFLALFVAAFTAGCEVARRRGVALALVAPPLWVVLEWVRTYVLGGFPWVGLGYSQYRTTFLIQFAEFTGIYGVSALVVLVNVSVYGAFRRRADGKPPRTGGMLAVTALLVALVAWGYVRVEGLRETSRAHTLRVALVQGNVAQDEKWDPAYQLATIDHYEALTEQVAAEGAELVVWPETAAPFFFQEEGELRERILAIARRLRVWLLVGSPAFDQEGDRVRLYNRVYLVTPDGRADASYDKMELVPFGEYVPLARVFSFVHKIVEGVGDFRAGATPIVFHTPMGSFGTLICYEGIFPGLTRRFVDAGADFLVNVTNDAWFGRTSAPYQHLAMGTVRAIENRVPIVRVANTGFSAIVDVDGTIRWRTNLFETVARVDTIAWSRARTVYTRVGDVFVYGCMILLTVTVLVAMGRSPATSPERRSM